ncbi:MAG: ATP-binding protein [Bacillus sp. (in: firmicutes)]
MLSISLILLIGLSISPITWEVNPIIMSIQVILVSGIILSLILFVKYDLTSYKKSFIFLLTIYMYNKFWVTPDSAIMLGLFAIAPLLPIFLFDVVSFYIVATMNIILGPLFIYIISHTQLRYTFTYLTENNSSTILNFITIQVLLLFVFIGTNNRVQSLKALHQEMQQAKQLHSVGQMAATIAHEIRNPITVVKGFAQLLNQQKDLDETQKYYIQTMLTELNHTEIVINDYLSLTKSQTEHIQKLEINQEINKISQSLDNFAHNHQTEIQLHLHDTLNVEMNQNELKQLIVNIMKNGIEAMSQHGIMTVTTSKEKDKAKITITDSGIGMTKEQIDSLGTPFYTLKEAGTGIGLTVCYKIIEKYKGEMKVHSEVNKGTSFIIYLPLV